MIICLVLRNTVGWAGYSLCNVTQVQTITKFDKGFRNSRTYV